MSKEREVFEQILRNGGKKACSLEKNKYGGYVYSNIQDMFIVFQQATTHYRPLLEAKDAEIARLSDNANKCHHTLGKISLLGGESYSLARVAQSQLLIQGYIPDSLAATLIEQNTTLKAVIEQAREGLDLICTIEGESGASQGSVYKVASKTLAAINAASCTSQKSNGNQTCETSYDPTGEK